MEADGTAALSMVDGTGQPRATFTLTSADSGVNGNVVRVCGQSLIGA